MHSNLLALEGSRPPRSVGRGPRFLLLAAVAGLTVAACNNGAGDQTQGPIAVGMTSNMMSSYNDGLTAMYEVQTPVRLPVRPPTGQEASAAAPAGTPYPHAPFLTAADEQIEVHYTLSNVDDQEQAVWLLIYPWNEFARWKPGITVVNDEESLPNFGYDQYFVIPAKSRLQGTITTDDMHEIAIKLATVENLLAKSMGMGGGSMMMYGQQDPTTLANHIMNPQNRS